MSLRMTIATCLFISTYSGIPIFRATEGKVNEFELSGGSKNRAYNYRVWRVKGSWVWLEYRGAFSIYQNLSETSIERSIEWRTCSIWHKFHSFMLSSPKCKMVAKILPRTAWNCWFLVKTRKWNTHFHWKISDGKTGLPFQNSPYSREFSSGTPGKSVFY